MLACENFDSLHVWHNRRTLPQDAQKGQTSHPPSPGAPRRALSLARPQPKNRPQAYPLGYVEDFDESRTKLADFFSILLDHISTR
jgi:hypothetical protein